MAQYILFLRGTNEQLDGYSAEELQQLFEKYDEWVDSFKNKDQLRTAQKLIDGVRHEVRVEDGKVVDGPFAETKETIGGFFVVECATLKEAAEIAKRCPVLIHGGSVELRELHTDACRYSG